MAKSILEEAVADAELLKKTAIENAKNVLVEAISPKIKEFVDTQLGEMGLPTDMLPEMGMYEKHDDEAEDMDLLKKMGLLDGEEDSSEEADEEAKDEEEDEDKEEMAEMTLATENEMNEESEMNEEAVVEMTNEDLKKALEEVLGGLSEAQVTKGFADAKPATDGGLADKKAGESQWSDEDAPAAQDWTVKEAAYKKKVEGLVSEVKKLQNENKEYKEACNYLKRNLQEVNLFNSKLLFTNKLLHSAKLNNEQRLTVIEAFDTAQNLREVELVYKSLSESLKIAGVLGESKQVQKTLKGPKASRLTTPSSTVLKESAGEEQKDSFASRMQELAGLVE